MGLNYTPMNYEQAESVDEFKGRLKKCIDQIGSLYAFLQITGFPKGTVKGYLAGSEPGRIKLVKLARALNISPAWLAFGIGEPTELPKSDGRWIPLPVLVASKDSSSGKIVVRPGAPALQVSNELVSESFRGAKAENLMMFRMPDSVLSETIEQNEWVILHLADRDPGTAGVFCVALYDTITIRHVGPLGLDGIRISTDDSVTAPPIDVPRSELGKKIQIIGRALIAGVWVRRRLKMERSFPIVPPSAND